MSSDGQTIWRNIRPSSVRLCRPIQFQFTKETNEKVQEEYDHINEKIMNLKTTNVNIKRKKYYVSHKLYSTMVDGKVCNVLTGQASSASCNICRATPNQMNQLDLLEKLHVEEKHYYYGLSTLHCRIRFMECILHIAYNLDFEKFYAKGNDKQLKQERKKLVQDKIRSEMSLIVDVVKQGHGTTNDGNTARRFFDDPEKAANATGVDSRLIQRFAIILQILTSGYDIDYEKFEKYALDTAKLFVELYDWYKMPPCVHKVLLHGANIMKVFGLPIGWMSEEAQEANNKIFKEARLRFSRLFSRFACNEDVIHFMLVSSDPIISALRVHKQKKIKRLCDEAKNLLISTNDNEPESDDENRVMDESADEF